MIEDSIHPLKLLRFENLSEFDTIRHFVSTRIGGFSAPPFDSLNLGFKTADDSANVLRNRERLASSLGISLGSFAVTKQIHENRIAVITPEMRGSGSTNYESGMDATDGLVTNVPDICLMVLLADCTPLLFYDPVKQVIGATHAGWRGTVKLIGRRTVEVMKEHFGSRPSDIIVGIGPSIGPCCYEVGAEVISQVESAFGMTEGLVDGRRHLDLWEANLRQLLDAGVPRENIEVAGVCTRCHADMFFSERYSPGTGRFGVGIMLNHF